jgi:hypothetical protein
MKKKRKGLHSWVCKSDYNHEGCNGLVLESSIMSGVQGIAKCKCECHDEATTEA